MPNSLFILIMSVCVKLHMIIKYMSRGSKKENAFKQTVKKSNTQNIFSKWLLGCLHYVDNSMVNIPIVALLAI